MPTVEDIRLREPLPQNVLEALKGRDTCIRRLRIATQPALLPRPLPWTLVRHPHIGDNVAKAAEKAVRGWHTRMAKIGVNKPLFDLDYAKSELVLTGRILIRTGKFDIGDVDSNDFGADVSQSLHVPEPGRIVLYWDESYRVKCGVITVPDDIHDVYTLRSLIAHELGHALLLGHFLHDPGKLMHPDHTAVLMPKRGECKAVKEIWGL